MKESPSGIRFEEICKIAEEFEFHFKGGKGSHRIFVKQGIKEMLNFQNDRGMAKPYQVKQFLKIIEKYDLVEE